MDKINIFSHIFPSRYKEKLIETAPKGTDIVSNVLSNTALYDLDERFRVLDKFGDIKEVLSIAAPGAGEIAGPEKAAELTKIANDGLAELIRREPEALLGPAVIARFGRELPFLLKVLACEQALSLQTHPDADRARQGFARENAAGLAADDPRRCYRDPRAKPELICALSRFEALCGFLAPADALLAELARHVEVDNPHAIALVPGGPGEAFALAAEMIDPVDHDALDAGFEGLVIAVQEAAELPGALILGQACVAGQAPAAVLRLSRPLHADEDDQLLHVR